MSAGPVPWDRLTCQSVLDGIGQPFDLRAFGSFQPRAARLSDVLYLPELGLQLANEQVVPLEAVQDGWNLDFELKREFQDRAGAYANAFDCLDRSEDVCILANFFSRNFFHWITEELPKVHMLERSGFRGSYVVSGLPAFATQFLALLGVSNDRMITELAGPTRFRSAVYVSAVTALGLGRRPELFFSLRDSVLDSVALPRSPRRRLWLDRRTGVNNVGRELLNPDEVYPLLDRFGFEVIDIAEFPVAEQIAIARDAEALSGPHGAGFVHTMFMAPESAVIECFSPLFINPGVFDVCRLLRHRYSMLVYEHAYDGYAFGNRLLVNCSHLELVLQSLD
jgi:capsular polysaccharide biosynthesis protein